MAAVHCLAGKGRTGTVVAAHLLFAGEQHSANDALQAFATARGEGDDALQAYVHYFARALDEWRRREALPKPALLLLRRIILHLRRASAPWEAAPWGELRGGGAERAQLARLPAVLQVLRAPCEQADIRAGSILFSSADRRRRRRLRQGGRRPRPADCLRGGAGCGGGPGAALRWLKAPSTPLEDTAPPALVCASASCLPSPGGATICTTAASPRSESLCSASRSTRTLRWATPGAGRALLPRAARRRRPSADAAVVAVELVLAPLDGAAAAPPATPAGARAAKAVVARAAQPGGLPVEARRDQRGPQALVPALRTGRPGGQAGARPLLLAVLRAPQLAALQPPPLTHAPAPPRPRPRPRPPRPARALSQFKSPDEVTPRGSIPLASVRRVEPIGACEGYPHCFVLRTALRDFVFSPGCEGADEHAESAREWMDVLVHAKTRQSMAEADDNASTRDDECDRPRGPRAALEAAKATGRPRSCTTPIYTGL